MKREIQIGDHAVGEIGINHNGDLDVAKNLIERAHWAGADAVKFQKRTPEICVPKDQQSKMRETPWGYITYLDYRYKVEFEETEYREIDRYCKSLGMDWFVSVWDTPSVDFMEQHFDTVAYKLPSASLTDHELMTHTRNTGRPLIISTGMSTADEVADSVQVAGLDNLLICHTTSTYPCPVDELNLKMVETLRNQFPNTPIGYSGHETGLVPSVIATAFGACFIERHITLDRAMWGSDQAASVEPGGLRRLVKYLRLVPDAVGDGVKQVYPSEMGAREKLRVKK